MPLSDFGFNFAAPPQEKVVFNGFGSAKRKFAWETPTPQHDMMTDNECPAKRICSATHLQAADLVFQQPQEQNVACSQLSNFSQWPLSSLQQQVDDQSVFGCFKGVGVSLQQQQNLACSAPQHTESDMVMDLCDETYSSAQHDADLGSVSNCMDSDCVPNPEQYKADAVHSSNAVSATDKKNIIYCSTPCKGGERSPSSNAVRCFCRPVDAFLNLGPYVSDYY